MSDGRGKLRSAKDTDDKQDHSKTKHKKDECGSCKKLVGDQDTGVFCEICELWYHCRCQGIPEAMYNVLNQHNAELHWFCKNCNTGAGKLLMTISKISTKVEKLEEEMVKIKAELHAEMAHSVKMIKDDLAKMENRIEQSEKKVDEYKEEDSNKREITPQWSDIVSREVDAKMSVITADMSTVQDTLEKTKLLINEQKDKESRANNVIVYNIAETTVVDRKEWMTQEKSYCLNLFNEALDIKIKQEDIKRMLRLGKLEDNKCRPILIEFRDKAIKNQVIECAPKLRYASDLYSKTIISHDMTVMERAECRKLVNDAKLQEANDHSGEWIYRVRGAPGQMRIVKLRRAY